ncbi:acyltransferase [Paenibacillus naphthalenovorans]|uniref:acyltransferase n=1 Tax=Paenibacillus naphthalenovorans TaxID=162209 RepID=UPI003D29753B
MATAKPKSKPKLLELDVVRAIAILAVLIIHSTSDATVELPIGSGSQAMYLALNKLSNFAVPVFIIVSGIVLFYKYQGESFGGKQVLQFYVKRVKHVLFPYVLWSLFYYLYNQWIFDRENLYMDWSRFADLLPWAEASYHLYFMVIIVQFYLLFPLMMWLCRFAWFRRSLIWIGLVIQAVFYSYNHWVEPINHMPSLCVNYFSMFTLGGWIGLHYETFAAWLRRHAAWVLPAAVVIGCSFLGLFMLEGRTSIVLDGAWYHVLFFVYAAFAGLSLIRLGQLLIRFAMPAARALMALGAVSFGIYLIHPAVLTYYRTHFPNESGAIGQYHLYTFTAFALSLIIPWILTYAYGLAVRLLRRPKPKSSAQGA